MRSQFVANPFIIIKDIWKLSIFYIVNGKRVSNLLTLSSVTCRSHKLSPFGFEELCVNSEAVAVCFVVDPISVV